MTRDDAIQWLRLFGDTPDDLRNTCIHGHAECSTHPAGECLDDVIKLAIPPEGPK